ncbi:hypothetical protein IYQ_15233 [Aeromonas salmonicida subsp. salmonicida 01-B526]|uniref:Uncharacterized protein n=1 Tax=Aeromonas salmonicida subsp. salmonicida 01-B526 TaxID=1076135 RepID=A0ABP2MYN2_AERSS|nr:hypothetical protein IYQ_15233 [Aeromonas salmonicida subsp. salmonicida 01-B526]
MPIAIFLMIWLMAYIQMRVLLGECLQIFHYIYSVLLLLKLRYQNLL